MLNKGQWVFIEKEASLERRRRLGPHPNAKTLEPFDEKTLPKAVEFGFYVRPTYNDPSKVTVFNIDAGITQDVEVRQVRSVGESVSEKVQADEKLSVMRELFFYKTEAVEFQKSHPKSAILPGRHVLYKGSDYILIETNGVNALIEDTKGRTSVVGYGDLKRGVGKSTPGKGDDFFDKSGGQSLYAGQWVMAPSRPAVLDKWGVSKELAVIFQIERDGKVDVFYCLDGEGYRVEERELEPFPPNFQSLYSSKQPFKLFKLAAVEGNMKHTKRNELGSRYTEICLGEYDHTLKYLGDAQPDEDEDLKKTHVTPVAVAKVGNETKLKVDAQDEIRNRTGLSSAEVDRIVDEAWDLPKRRYEDSTDAGDGYLLGVIAIGTLLLISMGGAVAAL